MCWVLVFDVLGAEGEISGAIPRGPEILGGEVLRGRDGPAGAAARGREPALAVEALDVVDRPEQPVGPLFDGFY
jgi:hypothetical protein